MSCENHVFLIFYNLKRVVFFHNTVTVIPKGLATVLHPCLKLLDIACGTLRGNISNVQVPKLVHLIS